MGETPAAAPSASTPQPPQASLPRRLYVNTMIFGIVAGVVSVLLLILLLLVQPMRAFVYFIATFEIGLVAIVIYAIFAVYEVEAKLKKRSTGQIVTTVNISTCPDYFDTARDENDKTVCRNGYVDVDTGATHYFVRRNCVVQDTADCSLGDGKPTDFSVPLDAYSSRTTVNLCTTVNTADVEGSSFASVPWTDVKSRCNSLSLGDPAGPAFLLRDTQIFNS